MKNTLCHYVSACPLVLLPLFVYVQPAASEALFEFSGSAELELTIYADNGLFPRQDYKSNASVAVEPELYWEWNDGNDSVTFTPFVRADERDAERSHGDIRELSWVRAGDLWEFRTGIRKVFWGVTEFTHLVDVINQTDSVDSFDGEEKLGQPMFNVSRVTDWGIIDGFVLLGFRERTFAGSDGRLRSGVLVDTERASFESSDEKEHVDYSLRWSHSVDVFDIGVYWFDGTDRTPIFQPQSIAGNAVLTPYYQQVSQWGVDLQATVDSWLWKFEGLHKESDLERYLATQAGFEYTLYGINKSFADVGLLLEYGWDERGIQASSVSQNDIYVGARLTLNDVNDTALLIGGSYDVDFHSRSLLIEASRRLNDYWTISLEGLLFTAKNANDIVASLDQDDRLQLTLERYF